MSEKVYENFRTVLTMNLCNVIQDSKTLTDVLKMVDITLNDFEISRKSMDIIPCTGVPEVVKYYLASKSIANLSRKTIEQYHYKLINFFNMVKKSYLDITANDIRIYLYNFKINRNASDSYIDNVRITLNSFFQWLTDNDYLPKNPCAKVEKIKYQQKKREPLSTLSLEDLRYHCEDIREKALVDFLYSTGCRVSECSDVNKSDINWENNSVIIRHGKGDKERIVYFNDESKITLREYLKTRNDNNDALFVSMKAQHTRIQSHAIENIIHKIGEKTGVKAYPHKLRHTFATVGLRNGIPLEKLQTLLGHSDPKTTLIYAKNDTDQLKLEHQRAFC